MTNRYVSSSGSNIPPYTSWATAATTIQPAVSACFGGDTIYVDDGTYALASTITATVNITIRSKNNDPATAIIDGQNICQCVNFISTSSWLIGFTITRGNASSTGGGVNSGSISNCILSSNTAVDSGGGTYNSDLYNCTLTSNTAYRPGGGGGGNSGGGSSGGTLRNCILTGNSAGNFTWSWGTPGYGGGAYNSILYNCLLKNNAAYWGNYTNAAGGGVSGGTLYNCTLVNNMIGGGGSGGGAYDSDLYNCISWGNVYSYGPLCPDAFPTTHPYYSCGIGADYAGGVGCITDDPLFVSGVDFSLQETSPCINVGINQPWMIGNLDLAGNTRILPVGWIVDMGAYEFVPIDYSSSSSISSSSKSSSSQSTRSSKSTSSQSISSSLSSSTEIRTSSSSRSSSSTEIRTSSSSSFGDARDLFYFVDKFGDFYILRGDEHRAESSLIFKSFSPISNPPMGVAMSYFVIDESSSSSEIFTSSSSSHSSSSNSSGNSSSSTNISGMIVADNSSSSPSSLSSESSSESSFSTVNYDYNVFILRKKSDTVANLAIHNMDGYLKGSIDFSSGINFIGLSAWPNNDNLLVAISENSIHLLYIASGQIGVYSFESPVALTYGIACKTIVDENSADFFVRSKDQKEIVLIRISKRDKNCSIINQYASTLSKWQRLGGMACQLETYGLIGEMSTIYHVVEESKGYSHVSKTVILTGIPTLSFMYNIPFTVYGCCISDHVFGGPSLIEPAKSPTLNFRSYDSSGNFITNFNSLFMGNMKPGVKSDATAINMLVEGVTSISNVKIGIVENGIIGSDVNDVVMYKVSDKLDSLISVDKYFSGVNTDGISENSNNVEVGIKSGGKSIETKYIYLAIDMPKRYVGRGYLTFRWFFDYED